MAGFDDIKDKSLLSNKGTELLKARQERIQNKSVQEIRILEKIAQDRAEIEKLSSELAKSVDDEFDKRLAEMSRISARVEEMKKAVLQVEKGRIHGAEKSFKQSAMTMTSSGSTLSDISAASRSSSNLGPALTMAQGTSTGSLEEYIENRKALLARQNSRLRETASHIEGNEGQFSTQLGARNRLVEQIGQAQAAMAAQKKLGIDTQSSYYNAVDTTARVKAEQEQGAIRSGVQSGAFGDRKAVEERLNQVAQKLISTFEQLDEAVKSGAKEAGDLGKQFDSLEKDYKRNKDILGAMNQSGMGDGRSGLQVAGGIIGNLGTIAQGVGQGIRYVGVTSELAQAQNRIGFANMANQRFTDAYGATQGDMSALRRVMSDQYGEQVRRGMLLGNREDAAKLTETVGTGAKAVGTAIDASTGAGGIWSGVKGFFMGGPAGAGAAAVTEGLAKATPDALAFTQNVTDYSKQITQGQTFLQSAQQMRALQDAVAQIGDFSSQAAFDQQKGLTYATRGLGLGSIGTNYNDVTSFTGGGMLSGAQGLLPGAAGIGPQLSGGGTPYTGDIKSYIKGKEGLALEAYADTSRGYSIGYGSFVPGKSQMGRKINKDQADELFEKDFASHSGAVNEMLGEDVMAKLNEGQKNALYDLAYNAGPGSLKYGKKGTSIYSRLKAGDIEGAGQKILTTATRADGEIHPGLVGRRQDEYAMWTGGAAMPAAMPSATQMGSLMTQNIAGGGDRQNVQAMLSDPNTVNMIAQLAGLSGKDVNKLTGMGVAGLGKEFARDGGMGAVNDIVRGGQLSRIGYMQSPEQYMQARSAMTGVGGGAQDFEEILKNAVANGMDASKNIMEMVNATVSLSQRSAQAGIAAFGGAAEGLGMGIDALRKTGVSENMATAAAAAAGQASEDMAGDKGLDISNVIETARLRKNFGKAELWQLESMRTASPAQARQLRNLYRSGKTDEANELATKMGVGGEGGVTDLAGAENLLESTSEQVTRRATGFGINRQMEESIQEARRTGRPLTQRERSFMNSTTRGNVGYGVSGDAMLGYNTTAGGPAKGTLATDPGGVVRSGEDTIKSGAVADARVFEDGIKNISGAMGGLEALGANMLKVAEQIKPDEFAKSVKDAANDFKIPANALGTNVKELTTAVGDLTRAIKSIGSGKVPDLNSNVNMNQLRGR
jgi:GH24 family phage-related lysozyme (muramidase)